MKKSTMVELVQELEKLPQTLEIKQMVAEAKAGEFHDYKNNKYACGKIASVQFLMDYAKRPYYHDSIKKEMIDLAERIKQGEFDEEPDEQDKAELRKYALEGGFSEQQMNRLFGL